MGKRKEKGDEVEMKRIWVRVLPETHKALLHLAIDLDHGVERLAGKLLAEAIERARADISREPPKKR